MMQSPGYTPDLVEGMWTDLGAPATATNGRVGVIDPTPADPHRFYGLGGGGVT